jgi:putative transposase
VSDTLFSSKIICASLREYAGAIYHVMSRGNRGDPIYLDDKDCETFLDTLKEACTKTGWLVHAFVLMGNHYHLLLETPEANLVEGMKWLQGTYTQRFNARHKVWGHLLQGRYKAIPVDGSAGGDYFPTVANYIHLNPARSRAVDALEGDLTAYRWSSYPCYLDVSVRPEWLVVDRVLGSLGVGDDASGRGWYRELMQKRVVEIAVSDNPEAFDEAWAGIRRGWYLGSDGFRQDLMEQVGSHMAGKQNASFSGTAVQEHNEVEAERLMVWALSRIGVVLSELPSMRKGCAEKMAVAWLLKKRTVVKNEWISRHLCCGHRANIPGYVKKVEMAESGRVAELKKILKSED